MLRLVTLLLPALIPSWRFFKEVAASPRIEGRFVGAGDDSWRALQMRPDVVSAGEMALRMFWNRAWNRQLFMVSLSERLLTLHTPQTLALLQDAVTEQMDAQAGQAIAFRIWLIDREEGALDSEVVYESAPWQVGQ